VADGDLEAWDSVADAYAASPQVDWFDEFLDRHIDPHDLTGLRVLDLGCGAGDLARRLHDRGADVHAVDGSRRLLDIARTEHPGPTYEHVDLATTGIDGEYDLVVALMVLMDVSSLDRIRPRADRLVATILHPAFWNQQTVDDADIAHGGYRRVTGYLDHETWHVPGFGGHNHYHRPLQDHVAWMSGLGLGVTELFEPPALVYDGWRRAIPTRMGLAAYRIATGGS
jgi:SAM-dependent methyltransferase